MKINLAPYCCILLLLAADVLPAAEHSLLYVARAPRDRDGFRTLAPSIEVFDIDNAHALVKVIPLTAPDGTTPVMHIRGITASAATQTLYISHYGRYKDLRPGGLDSLFGIVYLSVVSDTI